LFPSNNLTEEKRVQGPFTFPEKKKKKESFWPEPCKGEKKKRRQRPKKRKINHIGFATRNKQRKWPEKKKKKSHYK